MKAGGKKILKGKNWERTTENTERARRKDKIENNTIEKENEEYLIIIVYPICRVIKWKAYTLRSLQKSR